MLERSPAVTEKLPPPLPVLPKLAAPLPVFYQRADVPVAWAVVDRALLEPLVTLGPWYLTRGMEPSPPKLTWKGLDEEGKPYQVYVLLNRAVCLLYQLLPAEQARLIADHDLFWQELGKLPRVKIRNNQPLDCRVENLDWTIGHRARLRRRKSGLPEFQLYQPAGVLAGSEEPGDSTPEELAFLAEMDKAAEESAKEKELLNKPLGDILQQALGSEPPKPADGCKRCGKPVAYSGAIFCGAACSAKYEAGDLHEPQIDKRDSPLSGEQLGATGSQEAPPS
jgi:hypothetical protein